MKKTLYQILDVDPKASAAEIAAAHAKRVEEANVAALHDPNRLVILQQAKEVLADPRKRAAYDASLAAAARPAAPAREIAKAGLGPTSLRTWGTWMTLVVVLAGVGAWWWASREAAPPAREPASSVTAPARPSKVPAEVTKENSATEAAPVKPSAKPILGAWSCQDAMTGETSTYDFQSDGTLVISAGNAPAFPLAYEVSGLDLNLVDSNQTITMKIEALRPRKLVLNTGAGGRRLLCTR